ncbi:Ionotropic receptor 130 [Frankliniella occidentalis]|nr:Ionotropic receptor 130 [Frankliniella occidentalis]
MAWLVLLALALLCPGAYDAVLLPDPRPALDSQGVAELVSHFLTGTTGGVLVYGRGRGLDAFLGQLPPEVPRSLAFRQSDAFNFGLLYRSSGNTHNIVLIAGDDRARLVDTINRTAPAYNRVLLWTQAARLEHVLGLLEPLWVATNQVSLAVSLTNGTTFLCSSSLRFVKESSMFSVDLTPIDQWVPTVRRWQRRDSPFLKFCSAWRSHHQAGGDRANFKLLSVLPDPILEHPRDYIDLVNTLTHSLGQTIDVEWMREENDEALDELRRRTFSCTLDALVTYRFSPTRSNWPELRNVDPILISMQVVVPAGLQRVTHLQALTVEFSAELWWATVVAVVAVTMATVLAARLALGLPLATAWTAAPLQALAPLLAQAPPGRTAHRPLSTVWLLMSVVLAAAYQGLLLRELTAPPGEINSLEQLEQSGLDVRMSAEWYEYGQYFLSDKLRRRITHFSPVGLHTTVQEMAQYRNTALVMQNDMSSRLVLSPYLTSTPKRLHVFVVAHQLLVTQVWCTTGSPLEKPLRKAGLRAREHGLFDHMITSTSIKQGDNGHREGGPGQDERLTRPLNLRQLQPAFWLLAYGFGMSTLALAGEIAYNKFVSRDTSFNI